MFIAHSQSVTIETCELEEISVEIGFSEGVEACFFVEIKGPALGADVGTWVAFKDCEVYFQGLEKASKNTTCGAGTYNSNFVGSR